MITGAETKFDPSATMTTALTERATNRARSLRLDNRGFDAKLIEDQQEALSRLTRDVEEAKEALDDAIVTLSAVRCVALYNDEWEGSGPHFYELCGETIRRSSATLTRLSRPTELGEKDGR